MIVYRLESSDGQKGIYGFNAGFLAASDSAKIHNLPHSLRPSPSNDEGISKWWFGGRRWTTKAHRDRIMSYHCGFLSKEQMFSWFHPASFSQFVHHNEKGHSSRIVVSLYEIDGRSVIKGEFQCMFNLSKAKLIEQHNPAIYLPEPLKMVA